MIVHDKTYRLEPDADRSFLSPTGRQCAWRIRIIDLNLGEPGVYHLRPIIVVAVQTGAVISLTSCAESVGEKIRQDFTLDINRVLWIEQVASRPGQWLVAGFKSHRHGPRIYYDINWRPIRDNERKTVSTYLPDFANK